MSYSRKYGIHTVFQGFVKEGIEFIKHFNRFWQNVLNSLLHINK